MFIRSAAHDTLQGRAIQKVNEHWGEDFRSWGGRETIGIPVCKKKYSPFCFKITDGNVDDKGERRLDVDVTRMYGCKLHSDMRRTVIEQHGVRKGWEPFGQWSLKKAQDMARKEADRLNQPRNVKVSPGSDTSSTDGTTTSEDWTSSDDEKLSNNLLPSMCNNGSCTWKVKAKYDNIYAEMHGRTESDDEE